MGTEQYPEVSGDESGLVPPQNGPRAEWPKKIRTLSAVELDRLTIDADGRFHWDGRLVNYEGMNPTAPALSAADNERAALDMLDRAAHEITDPAAAHTSSASPAPASTEAPEIRLVDAAPISAATPLSTLVAPVPDRQDASAAVTSYPLALAAPASFAMPDRMRLRLSPLQSIGALLALLALLVAAAGMAAQGLATAHEWGCRTGLTEAYCPKPPPAPAPTPRIDLPA